MKYLFTFFCLIATVQFCIAGQDDSTDVENNILYFKDPRVDVLQKMYSRKPAGPKKNIIRVQVFQSTTRDKIFEAKAQFSARYPGIATFITYTSPNFRLRVGEFDSKQEAFNFMKQLKAYFPSSFVIEENPPNEKQNAKKN